MVGIMGIRAKHIQLHEITLVSVEYLHDFCGLCMGLLIEL
jgi:hypothetical protein